jgi:hypothetical protein
MSDGLIIGIVFGGMFLMMAAMMPFVMIMSKHRKQEKQAKLEEKTKQKELELKTQVDLKKAEWEADKTKPVFCKYCGAQNRRTDSVCVRCGGSLAD